MLLFLSKLLPALLFPPGLVLLVCLFAAWMAIRRGAWLPALLSLLAFLLLGAASCPRIANNLILGLEQQNPPSLTYPKAAAIVLLGGSMMTPGAPRIRPETNAAGDRVMQAARLWKQKRAPVLVVTGGYIWYLNPAAGSEASEYASLLSELFDVPESALRLVAGSRTTQQDAALSARLFDSTGMKKEILLVTSAAHMPRAAALFRKQGFTVIPAPTDFNGTVDPLFWVFETLPSAEALALTTAALHEYVGGWAYKRMGYL